MIFFLEERIKVFLEKFFNPETKPVQSLLFYGEEAIGKRTIALAFAKALLCQAEQKTWNGCGHCQNCLRFDKDLHPDFLLIEPVDKVIPIETARKAIEFLYYVPQFSSLKILIINEADKLKEDVQNTLLKTLEEPPQNTLIIFLTVHPQGLLTTVLSRLLALRFYRSSSQEITDFLIDQQSLSLSKAKEIAEKADGKIGLAFRLLDNEYLKDIEKNQKELAIILESDFLGLIKYLQELTGDKVHLLTVLKTWLEMLNKDIQIETQENKRNLKLPLASKVQLAKELFKAFNLISNYNINSSLLLENIFLKYKFN
ncbi:MAG: AAA family ATPase [Candidatus Paceibacterota bacterium]|jgi:DNA polymerase III gamma/tau subunit